MLLSLLIVTPALAQSNVDYDADNDGLIEISTLEQLNAIRHDLNGSGSSNHADYTSAFPNAVSGMGCPSTGCTGYELNNNLDFDTGTADDRTDDTYHNGGAGWNPIGVKDTGYTAAFEGNGNTISNLFMNRSADDIGLFADIGSSASIRNLGLVDVNVSGGTRTGALVGHFAGDPELSDSYVTGTVTGASGKNEIGGLAGFSDGNIVRSYFTGTVSGPSRVGGLVGFKARNGTMSGSYADVTINVDNRGGGLVGQLGGIGGGTATITNSYAAGSVSGTGNDVAGLVGYLDGSARVTASYASVDVTHTNPSVSAGLIGWRAAGTVENSYYDTDVAPGLSNGAYRGSGGTATNVSGKTAAELQAPTSAAGIYSTWDASAWHFGTSTQYPALKADLDGNNSATWQEFGYQIRETLTLTANLNTDSTRATVRWNQLTRPSQWGNVRFTYQVYRGGTEQGDPRTGTSFTDSNLAVGPEYAYQVAALLNDAEVRRSNVVRVGGYDTDDDGLIAITSLAQLNAMRWDLDGNGDPSSNRNDYFAAFPSGDGATTACPHGTTCNGYELMADLDFDTGTAGDRTDDTYYNGGAGWAPVGPHTVVNDSHRYNTVFDGNGNTISNLFINRGSTDDVGLFGAVGTRGVVRNLGLDDASVTGRKWVGTLVGSNYGTVTRSYATGTVAGGVSGDANTDAPAGGLVGALYTSGKIVTSYAAVEVSNISNGPGGLVGISEGAITASYATGPVRARWNDVFAGGLAGGLLSAASVDASYATGPVSHRNNGLLGRTTGGSTVTNSYFDTDTSGQDAATTYRKTTAELTGPTGYDGIYSRWNVDLDGDGSGDDPWDFGTSSQYPALKVDFNGDGRATWQEFGYQVREATSFTRTEIALDLESISFEWNAVTNHWRSQRPVPTVSYALYRDGTQISPAEGQTSTRTSYTDSVTAGQRSTYHVAALVNGVPARWDSVGPLTISRDRDNDGLIDITSQAQLNAIRYDLDGDGTVDDPANANAFAALAPSGSLSCPDARRGECRGYELLNDITLSGSWTPIGGNLPGNSGTPYSPGDSNVFTAEFHGDDKTISGLRVSAGSNTMVGLFGAIGSDARIHKVCLENVNVRGLELVGALVGYNQGMVHDTCSTGEVTGNALVGGLVGWNRGTVERSYSRASVTGFNTTDASGPVWSTQLGGLVGQNAGTVRNTYATGRVTGVSHVAGLVGSVWDDGSDDSDALVEISYSIGPVSSEKGWPLVGGLVGWVYGGRVDISYWNTQTSGQDEGESQISVGGIFPDNAGKTTAQLQNPTRASGIYHGWDSGIWDFGGAGDYPCLKGVGSNCGTQPSNPFDPANNQRASVTVTAADPVSVTEGGASASYTVVLDGQPSGNVVIATSSSNGDVTAQPASLTFTRDNWDTAQTVSVRAGHDDDAVNDSATVGHTVSGAQGYAGIDVASVSVAVSDDDTASVTVSESSISLTEGESATYTVVLDTQPVGNVLISLFANGVTVQPADLTFTSGNWNTAQTVTVSAPHDDDTEDGTGLIFHGIGADPDSAYVSVTVPGVNVSITDDDEPTPQPAQQEPEPGSVTVSASSLGVREGDDGATYTVSLDVEPTANVVVTVSSDNGDVTAQPVSLTFTTGNWQSAQTVTVSAGEDEDREDELAIVSHGASGGNYDGVTVGFVTVIVTDDDSTVEVLRDFYDAADGGSWSNNNGWLSGRPLAEWHGVTVNEDGEVTHLALRDNNLAGTLAPELGKLDSLEVVSLDRNSIGGSLPVELGDLSNLTRLALNRNSLTGAIPTELGGLTNLSIIGLARNQLSGSLPASLGNLTGLTRLSLHDNTGLSGALPSGFTNMADLERLAIANTGLCAPDDEGFSEWLDGVADKPGGVATCQ